VDNRIDKPEPNEAQVVPQDLRVEKGDCEDNEEAFNDCQRQRVEVTHRNNRALQVIVNQYRSELLKVEAAGIIQRMRWLFTGINK